LNKYVSESFASHQQLHAPAPIILPYIIKKGRQMLSSYDTYECKVQLPEGYLVLR